MQLVATHNRLFFRAQSVTEEEIESVREAMLSDTEGLEFQTMTDKELENMLNMQ